MCLFLEKKQTEIKIATRNITVWKVIKRNNKGLIYSLKINGKVCKWERGYHYTELDFRKKALTPSYICKEIKAIEGNAFHSYKRKGTRWVCESLEKEVKMIIPKGAMYYTDGKYYASSDIIFPHEEEK